MQRLITSKCVRQSLLGRSPVGISRSALQALGGNPNALTYGARFLSSYPEHTVVPMPALSPTMEAGSIASWNLKEGDAFEAGTAICEVETDKATVTYEAQDDGYIAKILVGKGEIEVGQPMMVIVNDSSDVAAFSSYTVTDVPSAAASAPAPTPAPAPIPTPISAPASAAPTEAVAGNRVVASPLARKLARDAGVDIALFEGSGPGGRIISADIAKGPTKTVAVAPAATAAAASAAPVQHTGSAAVSTAGGAAGGVYEDFLVSDAAREFASRLVGSKQQVPHFHLSVEVDLSKLEEVRAELNGSHKCEISVMDFMVKAAALSMKAVPDVNGSWHETFVRHYHQVDINLVMGSGMGLTLPVIRDVGAKGLKEIASEVMDFEDALFSDDGALLDPSKVAVGTFSIHNLGMYGVKSAAPIVLPPQGCALAVGAVTDTVVPNLSAKEGEENWKVSPVVTTTLSCDHRVIDGAVAAAWLASYKSLLENPMSMML